MNVVTILMLVIGILFMLASFFATGIAGAFSGGPYRPITKTGRIIIFVTGLAVFISAVQRILAHPK